MGVWRIRWGGEASKQRKEKEEATQERRRHNKDTKTDTSIHTQTRTRVEVQALPLSRCFSAVVSALSAWHLFAPLLSFPSSVRCGSPLRAPRPPVPLCCRGRFLRRLRQPQAPTHGERHKRRTAVRIGRRQRGARAHRQAGRPQASVARGGQRERRTRSGGCAQDNEKRKQRQQRGEGASAEEGGGRSQGRMHLHARTSRARQWRMEEGGGGGARP